MKLTLTECSTDATRTAILEGTIDEINAILAESQDAFFSPTAVADPVDGVRQLLDDARRTTDAIRDLPSLLTTGRVPPQNPRPAPIHDLIEARVPPVRVHVIRLGSRSGPMTLARALEIARSIGVDGLDREEPR